MRTMILASMLAFLPASAVLAQEAPKGDKVYTGAIATRWGKAVTPENAWRSYPRPQLQRDKWQNLNGLWDYAITRAGTPQPTKMDGKILVPFAVESRLSGVARKVTPDDRIWYRRTFTVPADWAGQNVRLNFGAVDYEAVVWVNGSPVGAHKGGSDAFGFDITAALKPGSNEVVVQVADPTSAGSQPRGKQILEPEGIWYTASSGIWQTVWIEPVSKLHIADVRATPNIDTGRIEVDVALSAWANDTDAVRLTVRSGGQPIASTIVRANRHASIAIPNAHLWSPEDPFLYDLDAELVTIKDPYAGKPERNRVAYDSRFTTGESEAYAGAQVTGAPRDTVKAYFAMRKISVGPGTVTGQPMLLLNNKPYFHNGTLDQGWWPDGLLTPPSEEAMRYDLEFLKKAGFNMVRKHIKVEPARYYYDTDRMGILVWQDMPSGGGEDQFLAGTSQSQAIFSSDMISDQQAELTQMIGELRAFPSIVMWVVNNEGWGQYDSATLTKLVRGMDPSRLVNSDSGWLDVAGRDSDVFDIHTYEDVPKVPTRQAERAIVIGEYGGVGRPIDNHLWRAGKRNWSYQVAKDADDYLARYKRKFDEIVRQARVYGLSAAVYTQTTDVEGEINGLLTYDRAVAKAPAEAFAAMAKPLWEESAPAVPPAKAP
ncbi:glycoside hydrolase family 2 TIM barrel-domain containing protein [Sphingomonas sp. HF-S4]|uniref:Glycoside hydrolase family 2 TIM barrel-domain containing protein n=1 Tax=Sphingomonas agrestis TaxID=3080540 RepID=A0ABU3Y408_9SPHN|nr:sugar-binding domain-containing protein [Sphingomonas sp. HF-S4]MDV3456135.1 glycoside hydrolase family 2 TIM barrel-domain containing protein [Sphingomonas sp. HF-S4]